MNRIAFLLDNDGTIGDTEPIHKAGERESLRDFGIVLTQEEHERYTGTTLRHMIEGLKLEYGIELDIETVLKHTREKVFDLARKDGVHMTDGAYDFIKEAHKMGIPMGIVSSGNSKCVNHCLEEYGIKHVFGAVVTGDNVIRGKPDKEPTLLGAQGLYICPDGCGVFEDSPNGIISARETGVNRIYAITTTYDKKTLLKERAHVVFDSFRDLSIETILDS